MRAFLLAACTALTLAACNNKAADDAADANADANVLATDNMMTGDPAAPGGMDGNMATNAATENAMVEDLTTNDADTNLANGM